MAAAQDTLTSPQQVKVLEQDAIKNSKWLKIDAAQEKNEPNLTLGHLAGLLNSLKNAFNSRGAQVRFPQASSFTLFNGAQQNLNANGQNYPLELTQNRQEAARQRLGKAPGPIAFVGGRLFADDVASILVSSKAFLNTWQHIYHPKKLTYDLTDLQSLQAKLRQEQDSKILERLAFGELEIAVEEYAAEVARLNNEIQTQLETEVESTEPLETAIKQNPLQAWQNSLKSIAAALTDANLGQPTLVVPNEIYTIASLRSVFNLLFAEFQKSDDFSKILARAEKETEKETENEQAIFIKTTFIYGASEYQFSGVELTTQHLIAADRAKAQKYLELFAKIEDELKKRAPATAVAGATEEEETDEDEGGDEEDEPREEIQLLTLEQIQQQAQDQLLGESWFDFLEFKPKVKQLPLHQQAWLKQELPQLISSLLTTTSNERQLQQYVQAWLEEKNLEPTSDKPAATAQSTTTAQPTAATEPTTAPSQTKQYAFSEEQAQALHQELNAWFFQTHQAEFVQLITVATNKTDQETTEEVAAASTTETKQPLATNVVPKTPQAQDVRLSAADLEGSAGQVVGKFSQRASVAFIGLYFGELELSSVERSKFQSLISVAIQQEVLKAGYSLQDLQNGSKRGLILNKIFPQVFRNREFSRQFFALSENFFQNRLGSLQLEAQEKINVYQTIDALIRLIDNPQQTITDMSDEELRERFALETKLSPSQLEQFRNLVLTMAVLRQAYYVYGLNLPVAPTLTGRAGQEKLKNNFANYVGPTRSLMKEYGQENVMAALADERQIEQAEFDQDPELNLQQQDYIKRLRAKMWREAIRELEVSEVEEFYVIYGVYDVAQIEERVVPAGFSYGELMQLVNADAENLNARQAAAAALAGQSFARSKEKFGKKLKKELGSKIAKGVLTAVAPELVPILNALEKAPVVGELVQKLEEELPEKILKALALMGAAVSAFLTWLWQQGLLVALGTIAGGILGSAIMPGVGTVLGAGLGGFMGNQFKAGQGLGFLNKKPTAKGIGVKASPTQSGSIGARLASGAKNMWSKVGSTTKIAVASTGTVVAVTAGSGVGGEMLKPVSEVIYDRTTTGGTFGPGFGTGPGGGHFSPYVDITKTPNPTEVEEAPVSITYSITIEPKDYVLTVTGASDEVEVFKQEGSSLAPELNKDLADFPNLEAGVTVGPGEEISFEYQQDYDSSFQDAMVVNTFTLFFDYCKTGDGDSAGNGEVQGITTDPGFDAETEVEVESNENEDPGVGEIGEENEVNDLAGTEEITCNGASGSSEALTLSSVLIGDAPGAPDGCLPATGSITQMPFDTYSHVYKVEGTKKPIPGTGDDAIDIAVDVGTNIFSPFDGKVVGMTTVGSGSTYGNSITISSAAGKFVFAHLSAFAVGGGDTVGAGQLIGKSGNTGLSSGPHLHYARANSSGRFYNYPLNSSSMLLQLHDIGNQVGCGINK